MNMFLVSIIFCIFVGITFMEIVRSTLAVLGIKTQNHFFEAERIEFWGYIQFLAFGILELYPRAVMHARCANATHIADGILATLATFVALLWSFFVGFAVIYIVS